MSLGPLRVDLLAAFVAVAEEGSFTRAAHRLYLSQPGLSRRIAGLEALLGATLLSRTSRDVELTAAGSALLPHARALLLAATAVAEAVRPDGPPASGPRSGGPGGRVAVAGTGP